MTSHKYFPIKTKTACVNKWTWSTIYFYTGRSSSCHRVASTWIDPENFDNFHNTEEKLNDRKLMLEGIWPSNKQGGVGCHYCKNIEDAGGVSERILSNTFPNISPDELYTDISAVKVSPKILEIYFDNVCNFACVYCESHLSSKINQEVKKFGEIKNKDRILLKNTAKHPKHEKFLEQFWMWFSKNHQTLSRLHILGGEPFYQKETDKLIKFFDNHPSPNLEFNIVSNIGIEHSNFVNFIDKIKALVNKRKIKRFDLTVSLDCLGPEAEYVRYGLNLDLWKKNFEYIVKEKWIYLNVNHTISLLTIKTLPDLISYINQFRKNRKIHSTSGTVWNPKFLYPGIVGNNFFDKDFNKVLQLLKENVNDDKMLTEYILGQKKQIGSMSRDDELLEDAVVYLNEIDKRRKTDWKKTFPWLYELTKNNVV